MCGLSNHEPHFALLLPGLLLKLIEMKVILKKGYIGTKRVITLTILTSQV